MTLEGAQPIRSSRPRRMLLMAAGIIKGGRYMRKNLVNILTVGLLGAWAAGAAWGQMMAPPLVIQVQPVWQPIPGVPGVQYVPTLRQDLFRYQNNYYYWHDGRWFQGQNHCGPWTTIHTPPPVFTQIAPNYWKTPPGWAHGQKTGWRGQPLPPGQMKKLQQPARPAAMPYGGGQVAPPFQPAPVVAAAGTEGQGQGKKGGPRGKMKHQGEGPEAMPAIPGGQCGSPGKGSGKFK